MNKGVAGIKPEDAQISTAAQSQTTKRLLKTIIFSAIGVILLTWAVVHFIGFIRTPAEERQKAREQVVPVGLPDCGILTLGPEYGIALWVDPDLGQNIYFEQHGEPVIGTMLINGTIEQEFELGTGARAGASKEIPGNHGKISSLAFKARRGTPKIAFVRYQGAEVPKGWHDAAVLYERQRASQQAKTNK